MREVKARVRDLDAIGRKLESIGANFEKEEDIVDYYFGTSSGQVLKIRKNDDQSHLVKYSSTDQGFEKILQREIEDFETTKNKLEEKHGLKSVLEKNERIYSWKDYSLVLISFEELGNFLVVQSEDVSTTIFSRLGVVVLDHVKVPFCDLIS